RTAARRQTLVEAARQIDVARWSRNASEQSSELGCDHFERYWVRSRGCPAKRGGKNVTCRHSRGVRCGGRGGARLNGKERPGALGALVARAGRPAGVHDAPRDGVPYIRALPPRPPPGTAQRLPATQRHPVATDVWSNSGRGL